MASGTRSVNSGNGQKSPNVKADLVMQICDEVKSAVQTPAVMKIIVDSIIESVTKIVVQRLEESLKFNTDMASDLRKEICARDRKIQELEENINELEQYQRRNSIRIFGIPEKEKENTDIIALQLFEERLGVELSDFDICRSHRIGVKKSGVHRPIIVKFSSYRARAAAFNKKRKLKGSGIVIREDLCAARLQLLQKAIRKYDTKNVYTHDGKIVVVYNGKRHFITNVAQLESISP